MMPHQGEPGKGTRVPWGDPRAPGARTSDYARSTAAVRVTPDTRTGEGMQEGPGFYFAMVMVGAGTLVTSVTVI